MICEWCLRLAYKLVQHHYPIPRRDGGTATVAICHECHDKCHTGFLIFDATLAIDEDECAQIWWDGIFEAIAQDFPGLWKTWTLDDPIPFDRVMMLNPMWKIKDMSPEKQEEMREAIRECKEYNDSK